MSEPGISEPRHRTMWLALAWISPAGIASSVGIAFDLSNRGKVAGFLPVQWPLLVMVCAPFTWFGVTFVSSIYLARDITQANNQAMRDRPAVVFASMAIFAFHAIASPVAARVAHALMTALYGHQSSV